MKSTLQTPEFSAPCYNVVKTTAKVLSGNQNQNQRIRIRGKWFWCWLWSQIWCLTLVTQISKLIQKSILLVTSSWPATRPMCPKCICTDSFEASVLIWKLRHTPSTYNYSNFHRETNVNTLIYLFISGVGAPLRQCLMPVWAAWISST